jgi:hypothetical protein
VLDSEDRYIVLQMWTEPQNPAGIENDYIRNHFTTEVV